MKNDETFDCGEMRRQFDLYELDLPSDGEASNFESHFQDCASCKNWLTNWEMVKVSAHRLPEFEVPVCVFENIMTTIAPAPQKSFWTNDLAMMGFGFGILLLALTLLASASFEESISWCFSFILLVAFSQFSKNLAKQSWGAA